MGGMAIFLLMAWVVGLMSSTTFGGTLHLFPFVAAVLGILYVVKRFRTPPPPPPRLKPLRGRNTWSV